MESELRDGVRLLTPADLPAVCTLAYDAGWNQTEQDLHRLLALEPEGCFGIDCEGRLVATTTLLCYGSELAWLGMVLTHKDYRRRGFARQLVEAALDLADRRGVGCVKLDASDQGRPLYLSLGFEDEQPIERWHRPPAPLDLPLVTLPLGAPDRLLDREAFGADRSHLLTLLGTASCLESAFVMHQNAFGMHRDGSRARYLGPCVAHNSTPAATMIPSLIAERAEEPWFWDLLPRNGEAVAIASGLGFVPARLLTRMQRGTPITTNDRLIYAIGGFEAG